MARALTQNEREAQFWRYVNKTGECWMWLGSTYKGGYGRFWTGIRRVQAHRYVWELFHGPIADDGLVVRHSCDTPGCVNPDHLKLGTQADNMFDASRKGRLSRRTFVHS